MSARTGLFALAIFAAVPAAAQQFQRPAGLQRLAEQRQPVQVHSEAFRKSADTHWLTGMLVGAGLGLWLGLDWQSNYHNCESGDCSGPAPIGYLILPTFVLGVLGAFIGDAFKKHHE